MTRGRIVEAVPLGILSFFVLVSSALAVFLPGFADTDAAVHGMDGAFFLEFFRELPAPANWNSFAIEYYARHPALGVASYPPLFGIVLAGVFAGLGISTASARLAVLIAAVSAVLVFYRWARRSLSLPAAFFAAALFLGNGEFVIWSREAMLEIPALLFLILAGMSWERFLGQGRGWHCIAAVTFLAGAVYTKQPAGFLIGAFILAAAFSHGIRHVIRDRKIWLGSGLFILLLLPLGIVTLKYGHYGTAQLSPAQYGLTYYSFGYWTAWLIQIFEVVHPFVVLLAVAGCWYGRTGSARNITLLSAAWIAVWFLAFSALPIKTNRFALFTVPPFCLLAGVAIDQIRRDWMKPVLWVGALGVVALSLLKPYNYVSGYQEAAAFAAKINSTRAPILYDGYHNANFIFHMLANDNEQIVLRGSKMLTSTASGALESYPIVTSETGLVAMLDRYGVQFILTEDSPYLVLDHTRWMRSYLRNGPFRLEKSVPISSNLAVYEAKKIDVYRYLNAKPGPETGVLEIFVPSAGMTIRADVLQGPTP